MDLHCAVDIQASNGAARQTSALSHDVAGNLTQIENADGSQTKYFYDDADRLYRIERPDVSGTFSTRYEWIYDYAGRKVVSQTWKIKPGGVWNKADDKRVVTVRDSMLA